MWNCSQIPWVFLVSAHRWHTTKLIPYNSVDVTLLSQSLLESFNQCSTAFGAEMRPDAAHAGKSWRRRVFQVALLILTDILGYIWFSW